jgi:ribokinase
MAGGIHSNESCGGDVRPIAVVGSLNADLVVRVERLPSPGETVLGKDLARLRGGKGGNQAVAAARLGGQVEMIARVGQDEDGSALIASLDEAGIDTRLVVRDASGPTGTAIILVEDGGANTVTVVPGANASLSIEDVFRATACLANAAAALSVTSFGTQVALPDAARVAAFAPSAWEPFVAGLSAGPPDAQTTG